MASMLDLNRSPLYTRAIEEFLNVQSEDPVTRKLNELVDELDIRLGAGTGRRLIDQGAWEW